MTKGGALLLVFVLFFLIFLTTVSAKVYINEIEANPLGTDSGQEWIELYNDGADTALTDWYIQDKNGDNHTLPGVVISDYYVFGSLNWVTNEDEILTLFDNNSVMQNDVEPFDDMDNDERTWSRVPDGTGILIFQEGSEGGSNENPGALYVPGAYETIQIAINAANPGDTIIVGDGTYTENPVVDKSLIIKAGSMPVINGTITITSSDVLLYGLTFDFSGRTAVIIDSSSGEISDVEITNNTFNSSASPSVGIHLGGGAPIDKVRDTVINENIFDGPPDMICNPWKIGGSFGSPVGVEIEDVNFERNFVSRCSIPINLHDENIDDILVDDNVFRDTDGVLYFWNDAGEDPPGVISRFVFTNNDVGGTNSYGIGFDTASPPVFDDGNFAANNRINFNNFEDIPGKYGFDALTIRSNLTAYVLEAENNWWGSCDGPGGAGLGSGSNVSENVDFDPWLGICFQNKSLNECSFQTDNQTLTAEVIGAEIESVWFSVEIDGVLSNRTGTMGPGFYFTEINSEDLVGGQNITWNVYANDTYGFVYNNSWKTFYVRNETYLGVVPWPFDGENGWWVTEPLYSLFKDPNGLESYYIWDNDPDGPILYTVPFGLEDIPNSPPIETAGILELNWWTDFGGVCENETTQSYTFFVDLVDPYITNLQPGDGEIIFNDNMPAISAYIDEIHAQNSGVDLDSVLMSVDGVMVLPNVSGVGELDALVQHSMFLADGVHNVTVKVSDNSGRNSELTWSFEIDSTPALVMDVVLPVDGVLNDRKVPFNISLNTEVEILEYINYADGIPKWKKLCKDCDEFGVDKVKTKTLREGNNSITIRASDGFGNFAEKNVSIFIDSKDPKIKKVSPKSGFSDGSFEVEFQELNPDTLVLRYGNESEKRTRIVDIPIECVAIGLISTCPIVVDLSDFDEQEITYFFNLTDIAGNNDFDKPEDLDIDMTAPFLTELIQLELVGNKATFKFNISEKNFDRVTYIDEADEKGKVKNLCTKLKDGICQRKVNFKEGQHNITFKIIDEAENMIGAGVEFFVDSKEPKIKKAEPKKGLTNGYFNVEFEEVNPVDLFLNYIHDEDNRSKKINISSCEQDKKKTICSDIFVNLTDFDGWEIEYWFNITDIYDQYDESKRRTLEVDVTPPEIHSFDYSIDNHKVEFEMIITDPNFDKTEYSDQNATNPKFKTLCSKLDDSTCEKKVSFSVGIHTLDIRALDEAGNLAIVVEGLEVDIV